MSLRKTKFLCIAAVIAVLCLVVFLSLNFPKGANASEESDTIKSIVKEVGVGNYQGLSDWMSKHVKYKADRFASDEWKEPLQTVKDGRGDCEDFATLALYCLKEMGLKDVFLLGVSRKGRNFGHVVTIFRESPGQKWQYYNFEKLENGLKIFQLTMQKISMECRYGSNPEYQLANREMKNVPKEEEDSYGINEY